MFLKIFPSTDYGIPLRIAERHGYHVTGHQSCNPCTQIETPSDDINNRAFSHQVYIHVGITMKKTQYERRDDARAPNGAAVIRIVPEGVSLRADSVQSAINILK
jgi:hypothetical protein